MCTIMNMRTYRPVKVTDTQLKLHYIKLEKYNQNLSLIVVRILLSYLVHVRVKLLSSPLLPY